MSRASGGPDTSYRNRNNIPDVKACICLNDLWR